MGRPLFTLGLLALATASFATLPLPSQAKEIPEIKANYSWIPVNVDGELENEVWKDIAARAGDFVLYNTGDKATQRTEALIAYDNQYLYVAFICYDSDIAKLRSEAKIFNGDDVEIFIDPGHSLEYTHVAVNPEGKACLSWQQDGRRNGVKAACKTFPDRWQAEIAIPFSDIKMPEASGMNTEWGINFCRAMPRIKEFSCWSPVRGEFHNPTRFGRLTGIKDIDIQKLRLAQNAPVDFAGSKIALQTDRTFYDSQKQMSIDIRLKDADTLAGKSLRLSLVDGKGAAQFSKELKDILLTNKDALDISSIQDGDYNLKVELIEGGRATASAQRHFGKFAPMAKPAHSTEIRDGVMYLDGQPHFPIGIWFGARWDKYKDLSEKDVADVADKGFNAIIPSWPFFKNELADYSETAAKATSDMKGRLRVSASTPFNIEQLLDKAAKNNLQVIFNIPFLWRTETLQDDQIRAGGETIRKYRNHPAILCWCSNDETDGWNELNRTTYRLYKELDPYRLVYLNLIHAVPSNRDNADILSTDPYPIGKSPVTKVSAHGDVIRQALKGRPSKSEWLVLQMFGSPAERWPRCPTPTEERCMVFLALNHGAKGLTYFAYHPKVTRDEGGDKFLSEELWQSMKELNRQTKLMARPYLLGKDVSGMSCDNEGIDLAAKDCDGEVHVIACNVKDSPLEAEIRIGSGGAPDELEVEFEGRKVPVVNGSVKDSFAAYAVHVYKYAKK